MAYLGKGVQYGHLNGQTITGNGSTATYALDFTVGSEHAIGVYVGNVHQLPGSGYNLASGGTQITFTENLANGETAYIRYHGISYDTPVPQDNSVDSAAYVDGSIDLVHMSANSVDSDQYVDGSIDAAHLAPAQTNITSVGTLTGLTVNGAAVFNENSADVDFRIESNTYDDMLFVDGGNNRVGIGTQAPNTWLEIDDNGTTGTGGIGTPQLRVGSMNNTNVYAQIGFGWGGTSTYSPITLGIKGTSGVSNGKGDFVLNTRDATTDSAPTEKFRITSAGNVGIGTTGPTGKLEIQQAQITNQYDRDSFLRLHPSAHTNSGGFTNIMFGTSTTNNYGVAIGGLRAGTDDTPSFSIRILNDDVAGTEMLRINDGIRIPDDKWLTLGASNDLGLIHDSSNSYISNYYGAMYFDQHVNDGNMIFRGDDGSGGLAEYFAIDGGAEKFMVKKDLLLSNTKKLGLDGTVNQYIVGTAANDKIEIFTNTSSVRALFNASGISGVINDTSDRALKENIVNLGASTTTLKALTPRTFDWKAETDANDQTGFIAQEIEAVNSNLVSGEEGHKAINTIGILAIAVKTIQELEARIATLEG
jgi:hypothetical protein